MDLSSPIDVVALVVEEGTSKSFEIPVGFWYQLIYGHIGHITGTDTNVQIKRGGRQLMTVAFIAAAEGSETFVLPSALGDSATIKMNLLPNCFLKERDVIDIAKAATCAVNLMFLVFRVE